MSHKRKTAEKPATDRRVPEKRGQLALAIGQLLTVCLWIIVGKSSTDAWPAVEGFLKLLEILARGTS